jgi:hypothetical protein
LYTSPKFSCKKIKEDEKKAEACDTYIKKRNAYSILANRTEDHVEEIGVIGEKILK